ncbi:hypothetical protein J6590_062584 [Homalodisca vitripennis]|nr:hypothetical protein J6590_062584 [Homalodisca vitripennis]
MGSLFTYSMFCCLSQECQPVTKGSNRAVLQGLEATLPRFGPKPPVFRRSDPLLRYQFHEPLRRSIENHVRYRRPYQEQIQYKQQLGQ